MTIGHDDLNPFNKFDDDTYVEAIWFVAFDREGRNDDWMSVLSRQLPDGAWQIASRFRYSTGGDAWDNDDRKSGYGFTVPDGSDASRNKAIDALNEFFWALRRTTKIAIADRVFIKGGLDAFARKLRKKPWMHMRISTIAPERPQ